MVNKPIIRTRIANIEKSVLKLTEKSHIDVGVFKVDSDLQDVVIHNLQLAIQGAIDGFWRGYVCLVAERV